MTFTIRSERPADASAVRDLVTAAFGQTDEARLIDALRADNDVAVALVAEGDDGLIGHILFSPMRAPFRALGLAPLSVRPAWQGQGVGAALVEAGLAAARADGWDGVFVLGDVAYYRRFGFSADLAAPFDSPFAGPHLMALALHGDLPVRTGVVAYAPAFEEV